MDAIHERLQRLERRRALTIPCLQQAERDIVFYTTRRNEYAEIIRVLDSEIRALLCHKQSKVA